MDSSSGMSSNSSDQDLQQTMDLRKRKRMISNRESARRSRLRKQKHMEELMAQVADLRRQNHQILTSLRATTQHHVAVESENAILRAQEAELSHRLHSLVEIIGFTDAAAGFHDVDAAAAAASWNCLSQPIMDLPRLLC